MLHVLMVGISNLQILVVFIKGSIPTFLGFMLYLYLLINVIYKYNNHLFCYEFNNYTLQIIDNQFFLALVMIWKMHILKLLMFLLCYPIIISALIEYMYVSMLYKQ